MKSMFLSWMIGLTLLTLRGNACAQAPDRLQQERIIRALSDPSFKMRLEATILVGKHKLERAIPGLLQALQDSEETVRAAAALSLARMGNQDHRKHLIPMLKDPNKIVVHAVEQGLIQLDRERGEPRIFLVVDPLASSSAQTSSGMATWVIGKVRAHLGASSHVVLSSGEEKVLSRDQLAQHLRRRKMFGFNVQAKIDKLDQQARRESTQTHCAMNALVVTLTEKRVEFVAFGEADAEIDNPRLTPQQKEEVEQIVLDAAAKAAADKALEYLKARVEP